jgi:hypothetical protein
VTPISQAPAALSEDVLLAQHGDAIAKMIRSELETDMQAERLTQVMVALSSIQTFRGKQYTAPKLNKQDGSITIESVKDEDGRDMFASVYNVFEADGKDFIGAVCAHAPKAIAEPDDPEDEDAVRNSTQANAHLRDFQRKFNPDDAQGELGKNAWVTGPTFGYTPYVSDAHKYGTTVQPIITTQEVPGPLGEMLTVPTVTGTKKYPKGEVELHLASVLYVTIPFKAKSLKEAPYLCYEYLEDKYTLKALHAKALKDANGKFLWDDGAQGERQEAFEAQQQAISPSGGAQDDWKKNKWRYSRWWIRPALFGMIQGEASDEQAESLAAQMEEQYPDGLRVTMVNGRVVDVKHERLDDVWSVCKVNKGGEIITEPLGACILPIQKDLNNFFNMAKEIILRTIVKIAINSQAFDREALKENDPVIYEYVPVDTAPGQSISDLFAAFPTAKMPDGLERIASMMLQLREVIGGIKPALTGGGQPAPTYRAEKQRRDQSLARFSPFYDCTRDFWKQVWHNALKQRARYGTGTIHVPGENGDGALDVDAALLDTTNIHIEVEEGIPVSITEETDRATWMLAESGDPDLPAKMGVFKVYKSMRYGDIAIPADKTKRMLGFNGIPARGEAEREKARTIIQRLLKEPPMRDIDPMTGQEITQPSIMPDSVVDDPLLMAEFFREWCISKAGMREEERNPDGFANVKAYLVEAQAMADQMMAPPPMPGEPPPDGGPQPAAPPMGEQPMPDQPPVAGGGGSFDTAPPPLG